MEMTFQEIREALIEEGHTATKVTQMTNRKNRNIGLMLSSKTNINFSHLY